MRDKIFESFLSRQLEEGTALAASSDLLDLEPVGRRPARAFIVHLRCQGLVKNRQGEVVTHDRFAVGVQFASDFLRRADTFEILSWISPRQVFHPNIRPPLVCIGHISPGTPLVEILYRLFDLTSGRLLTVLEEDALNPEACLFARNNPDRFPVDRRPLKRRRVRMRIERRAQAPAE